MEAVWLNQRFEVLTYGGGPGTSRNPIYSPAVYLWVRGRGGEGSGSKILYAGETGDMGQRPVGPGHEEWERVTSEGTGAISLQIARIESEDARRKLERAIIQRYGPVYNG